MKEPDPLRPIPFWQTFVLFAIPGAIVYLNIYLVHFVGNLLIVVLLVPGIVGAGGSP
jgi:hypothetical protein